jgi:radical SAM protein with 4Fe4S-binding SPASM domain
MNTVAERIVALGERNMPSTAWFELTYRCNASCRYCFIRGKTSPVDLPTEKILLAIDKLYDAGVQGLVLTGGEIFARPDLLEILEYAIAKDFFYVNLMTNGTLMTKNDVDFITKHSSHVRQMVMTVFSHDPKVNDAYFNVDGALGKILRNATALKQGGVVVHFNLNVLDINVETFVESRDFLSAQGFDATFFYPPIMRSCNAEEAYIGKFTNKEFYREFLSRLPDDDLRVLSGRILKIRPGLGLCVGKRTAICVGPDGSLKPCPSFAGLSIGSIFESSPLPRILESSSNWRVVCGMRKSDLKKCSSCRFTGICTVCGALLHCSDPTMSEPYDYRCQSLEALDEILLERGIISETLTAVGTRGVQ